MISLPLFGTDSPVQRSSSIIGAAVTFLFWLIFMILVLVIRPKQKPAQEKFKTVQIVLEDRPVEHIKLEDSGITPSEIDSNTAQAVVEEVVSVPVEEPVQTPVTKTQPVVQEPVKTPVKQEQPKQTVTEPVKAQTVPVPQQQPVTTTQPTSTQTQKTTPKTQTPFDWSMFDDDEPVATTTTPKKVTNTNNSAIQGTAGTSTTEQSTQTASSSSQNTTQTKTTSSSTTSSLSNIENATAKTTTTSGAATQNAKPASEVKTGGIDLTFGEGGKRAATTALAISLSDAAKRLIEQTVTVTIKITIEPDGSILRNNIIIPSSVLNATVRNEIINSISRWHFDASETSTTASFRFNIIVQ